MWAWRVERWGLGTLVEREQEAGKVTGSGETEWRGWSLGPVVVTGDRLRHGGAGASYPGSVSSTVLTLGLARAS